MWIFKNLVCIWRQKPAGLTPALSLDGAVAARASLQLINMRARQRTKPVVNISLYDKYAVFMKRGWVYTYRRASKSRLTSLYLVNTFHISLNACITAMSINTWQRPLAHRARAAQRKWWNRDVTTYLPQCLRAYTFRPTTITS